VSGVGTFPVRRGWPLGLGDTPLTAHAGRSTSATRATFFRDPHPASPPGREQSGTSYSAGPRRPWDAIRLDASAPRRWPPRALAMVQHLPSSDGPSAPSRARPGYLVKLTPHRRVLSAEGRPRPQPPTASCRTCTRRKTGGLGRPTLTAALAQVPAGFGPERTAWTFLAETIGDAVVAARTNDGATQFRRLHSARHEPRGRGSQPTPECSPRAAVTPVRHSYPPVRPSVRQGQFRPAAPPGRREHRIRGRVKRGRGQGFGRRVSTRTADETQIALYTGADGAGTVTPAGHWNQIAIQLAAAQGNSLSAKRSAVCPTQRRPGRRGKSRSLGRQVRLPPEWRPGDGHPTGPGPTATPRRTPDASWLPLLVTPELPELRVRTPARSAGRPRRCWRRAFGATNRGSPRRPDAPGVAARGVSRAFQQAAEEAGQSRILGRDPLPVSTNQAGLATGRSIGGYVLQAFALGGRHTRPPNGDRPDPGGGPVVTATNVTVRGQAVDKPERGSGCWR